MRLTHRLLAGSLILVSLLIAAVVIIAGGRLDNRLQEETRATLTSEARAIGAAWSMYSGDPDVLADSIGQALGLRVTLIEANGRVVGDAEFSGAALQALENHSHRPEIMAARDSGVGCSLRPSASAGDEEMYCAVRDPHGFVRVSMATGRFQIIVRDLQNQVVIAGVIALAAAIILAWIFSQSVSRPVVQLRDVARAIAAGDLSRRPTMSAPGEIGDLADALHRMAEQLGARLQALEQGEALMLAIIESLDEGILATNGRNEIVRLNSSARRLLDLRASTPFPADQLPPDRAIREAIHEATRGESPDPVETVINDRTLSLTARPLSSGGAVLAVMDLTQRRRLETIRRDFVANVSHELKTPLTVIAGFTDTLRDPEMAPEQREHFVDLVLSNTTRMQRIVDDLLDLSRYESRGWAPQFVRVDLEAIVGEVLSAARRAADEKGIGLIAAIDADARSVNADQTAVRQILSNLVENALRHTSSGALTVRVTRGHEDGAIWLSVEDTGCGIGPEHLPRIFERFYRVDHGRSRDAGGTGLGLAIVRHLVEAHGGRVRAESTVGKGTSISVSFPRLDVPVVT